MSSPPNQQQHAAPQMQPASRESSSPLVWYRTVASSTVFPSTAGASLRSPSTQPAPRSIPSAGTMHGPALPATPQTTKLSGGGRGTTPFFDGGSLVDHRGEDPYDFDYFYCGEPHGMNTATAVSPVSGGNSWRIRPESTLPAQLPLPQESLSALPPPSGRGFYLALDNSMSVSLSPYHATGTGGGGEPASKGLGRRGDATIPQLPTFLPSTASQSTPVQQQPQQAQQRHHQQVQQQSVSSSMLSASPAQQTAQGLPANSHIFVLAADGKTLIAVDPQALLLGQSSLQGQTVNIAPPGSAGTTKIDLGALLQGRKAFLRQQQPPLQQQQQQQQQQRYQLQQQGTGSGSGTPPLAPPRPTTQKPLSAFPVQQQYQQPVVVQAPSAMSSASAGINPSSRHHISSHPMGQLRAAVGVPVLPHTEDNPCNVNPSNQHPTAQTATAEPITVSINGAPLDSKYEVEPYNCYTLTNRKISSLDRVVCAIHNRERSAQNMVYMQNKETNEVLWRCKATSQCKTTKDGSLSQSGASQGSVAISALVGTSAMATLPPEESSQTGVPGQGSGMGRPNAASCANLPFEMQPWESFTLGPQPSQGGNDSANNSSGNDPNSNSVPQFHYVSTTLPTPPHSASPGGLLSTIQSSSPPGQPSSSQLPQQQQQHPVYSLVPVANARQLSPMYRDTFDMNPFISSLCLTGMHPTLHGATSSSYGLPSPVPVSSQCGPQQQLSSSTAPPSGVLNTMFVPSLLQQQSQHQRQQQQQQPQPQQQPQQQQQQQPQFNQH